MSSDNIKHLVRPGPRGPRAAASDLRPLGLASLGDTFRREGDSDGKHLSASVTPERSGPGAGSWARRPRGPGHTGASSTGTGGRGRPGRGAPAARGSHSPAQGQRRACVPGRPDKGGDAAVAATEPSQRKGETSPQRGRRVTRGWDRSSGGPALSGGSSTRPTRGMLVTAGMGL